MKLRINRKDVADIVSPRQVGENLNFLIMADWKRIPPGKAEIVDDNGKKRPVKLLARKVGFQEVHITATYLDQAEGEAGA